MTPPSDALRLAMFGDSIAYGQGATVPAHTVGARLAAALERAGMRTDLRVFAVPRARSAALPGQVDAARAWHPQVAVVIVGANDLTHFVPPEQAVAELTRALERLRERGCAVVVVPAPDLSVVPWVPPQFQVLVRTVSASLRARQVAAAIGAGATVADVEGSTAAAFAADPALFSADRFHPSDAGYRLIAQAIEPALLAVTRSTTDHVPHSGPHRPR